MKLLPDGEELRFERNQICTYNSDISELLKHKYNDSEEKYICFVNKSIYILINNTNFEILFNNLDLTSNRIFEQYYDLTVYKSEKDLINFIITYNNNGIRIYFYHCIWNISINESISQIFKYKYGASGMSSKIINCQIIGNDSNENQLICFYINSYYSLVSAYFIPEKNFSLIGYSNTTKNFDFNYLKSSIIKESNQIFICGSTSPQISCILYDYDNKQFNDSIYCEQEIYIDVYENIQTYYFREASSMIFFSKQDNQQFSCSIDMKGNFIKNGICEFHNLNSTFLFHFLSYNNQKKNYELITDNENINCDINDNVVNIVETILQNDKITEKINITKEKIIDELDSIMKEIEIGQIYEKIADDYSILIYPTNSINIHSSTYVNFSECETLLRNHYKIPNSTIMTFMQIELKNENSQSLINQVEYQAYDGNKTVLDLSLCDDVNINILYMIKNKSLIDFTTANNFKKLGIDVFNINDSFFNDICQPYSESDNDLILEDRIKDIYKNYVLCEEGCIYNNINFEDMTISCECKVKNNISMVISPLKLKEVEGSSTNFDVIKCYNLVFSLKGKLNNKGFLIFTFLVFAHIPLLIYYFTKGIKPVKIYIINEMKKYGYIKDDGDEKKKVLKKKIKKYEKTKDSTQAAPLKNKKKTIDKKITLKNINKIDNSSLINIMKSNSKEIKALSNCNKEEQVSTNIKKSKFKKKGTKILNEEGKTKILENIITQSFSKNMPEQESNPNENGNNRNNYNLINIDLNLYGHNKYIPPESHIILNNYTFEEAKKYDHRQICLIFYIITLSKQIFFHTFLYRSPIELFSLRLCLFIFIISSDLALNALFYFNDNISKKYRYAKNLFLFTFSDNITIIILSTSVGFILLTLFTKLSNSTNNIREIFQKEEKKLKQDKNYKVTEQRKNEIIFEIDLILKKMKIKIIILIIIELIIMLFFWYYVTAFCHVYFSTQISWLIDSSSSILSRAIIELLISLILAKLYRISIDGEIHCLYKFVMFLYNFG